MKIKITINIVNLLAPALEFHEGARLITSLVMTDESIDDLNVLYNEIIENIDDIEFEKGFDSTKDIVNVHIANQVYDLLVAEVDDILKVKNGIK